MKEHRLGYNVTAGKITDNLLKGDFDAAKPFEKLATDVKRFNICNEKIYLSPMKDMFDR